MSTQSRKYHLVVFGATGYTAKHVLQEIYTHGPAQWPQNFTWAIAGRNRTALERLAVPPSGAQAPAPEVLVADLTKEQEILQVAGSAQLLLNCVGPYGELGEPVVKACVQTKTNYLDLCGEPEFIERIWVKYDEEARNAGITVVSAAAYDSVPADLGVLAAVQAIRAQGSTPTNVEMLFRLRVGNSGLGIHYPTYAAAVEGFGSSGTKLRQVRKTANEKLGPAPRAPAKRPPMKLGFLGMFYYDPRAQGWLIPYFFSDPAVVRLTQRLAVYPPHEKTLGPTVPAVNFSAYIVVPSFWILLNTLFFLSLFSWLAKRPWGRKALLQYPGLFTCGLVSHQGPTKQQKEETGFTSTFHAEGSKPDTKATLRITGPEPGYIATPILFVACARAALGSHGEKMPLGVVTPGLAFQGLLERLSAEGNVTLRTIE